MRSLVFGLCEVGLGGGCLRPHCSPNQARQANDLSKPGTLLASARFKTEITSMQKESPMGPDCWLPTDGLEPSSAKEAQALVKAGAVVVMGSFDVSTPEGGRWCKWRRSPTNGQIAKGDVKQDGPANVMSSRPGAFGDGPCFNLRCYCTDVWVRTCSALAGIKFSCSRLASDECVDGETIVSDFVSNDFQRGLG
jgi:hypothetical protein